MASRARSGTGSTIAVRAAFGLGVVAAMAIAACGLFPSLDGLEGSSLEATPDAQNDAPTVAEDATMAEDAGDAGCVGPAPDPTALSDVRHVAVGNGFVCAVRTSGAVVCWGQYYRGQFGAAPDGGLGGSSDRSSTPVPVPGLQHVTAITAGDSHACAIDEDRHVWCWGWNSQGQLGNGAVSPSRGSLYTNGKQVVDWDPAPALVLSNTSTYLERALQISGGLNHTCAIVEGGIVACWGDNYYGQLGRPGGSDADGGHLIETKAVSNPIALGGAVSIAAGTGYSCAAVNGAPSSVRCTGANGSGQLGADPPDSGVPVTMPLPSSAADPVSVRASFYASPHTLVLDADGNVFGTGSNGNGALGAFGGGAPAAVPGLSSSNVAFAATGPTHTCAILRDGTVQCIGANPNGQLGRGFTSAREYDPAHVIVPGDPDASTDAGGAGDAGETGDAGAPTIPNATPLTNVLEVSVGFATSCAIVKNACRDDGTVYCWGLNHVGQLGNGTYRTYTRPIRVLAP